MKKIAGIAVLVLVLAITGAVQAYESTDWSKETVDSTGISGWYTSLALDGNNGRISYYGDGILKYASYNGSSWSTEDVDTNCKLGEGTSLVLNGSGYGRISYCDMTDYDLKLASYNGSSWSIETVDSAGWVGYYSSLVLDSSGNPKISYFDATNGDLKLASYNGSSWSIETVDSTGWVGLYTSLVLDGSNNPKISYYDSSNASLKYASYNGSSWSIETVDTLGSYAGRGTALALNGSGYPLIMYSLVSESNASILKAAEYNGSSWDIGAVDLGWVGTQIDIAMDGSNVPWVSFTALAKNTSPDRDEKMSPTLKYATKSGGSWTTEWADGGYTDDAVEYRRRGFYNSIAVGSDGKPRISYQNVNDNDLMFATKN